MDDQELIQLFRERNEEAIRETDAKYRKLCFGIAFNILEKEYDAEECVNDTYMSLWTAIPPAQPRCFPSYLSRIARNISLKRFRQESAQKRSRMTEVSIEELEDMPPGGFSMPDLDAEQLGKLINDFFKTEKESTRGIFIRKYFFFDSIEEITKRYELSENMLFLKISQFFQPEINIKQFSKNFGNPQ